MKITGAFVPHRAAMLKSPAWAALGLCARRVLDRLEIEHLNKHGRDNAELRVSYEQFEEFGIGKKELRRALQILRSLGFIEVARGRPSEGQFRAPNVYTLTYLPIGEAKPTDKWKHCETEDDVLRALASAELVAGASRGAMQSEAAPCRERAG